jgi:hypothetical protein
MYEAVRKRHLSKRVIHDAAHHARRDLGGPQRLRVVYLRLVAHVRGVHARACETSV